MGTMTSLRTGNQSAATSSMNAFASDVGQAQVNIKAARAAVGREIKSGADCTCHSSQGGTIVQDAGAAPANAVSDRPECDNHAGMART
jgi:hypothetical protein